MRSFVNDDDSYLDWLASHQDGFVVNAYVRPTADYLILHLATCYTINKASFRKKSWTNSGYAKVCATSVQALETWSREETGGTLHPCKFCKPRE